MKNNHAFKIGDAVKSETASGVVSALANFPTHTEYLVRWPDGTAGWVHQDHLTAVAPPNSKPKTNQLN